MNSLKPSSLTRVTPTAMSDPISAASTTTINNFLGGDAFFGIALALVCIFLAILCTGAILRQVLVNQGAKSRALNTHEDDKAYNSVDNKYDAVDGLRGEAFAGTWLGMTLSALGGAAATFIGGLVSSLGDALTNLVNNLPILIGLAIIAILGFVFNSTHDVILPQAFEIVQCKIQPVLNEIVYPLLNFARLMYSLVYPWVNLSRDVMSAWTTGLIYGIILTDCTLGQGIGFFLNIVQNLYNGVQQLINSFIDFVLNGLLTGGRWDMIPGLTTIFDTFNLTRPIADCLCQDATPIWDYYYALPESPSLYLAIDCAVNSIWKVPQIFINILRERAPPDITPLTNELICAEFAVGDYAEDVGVALIEMLTGIWNFIDDQVNSMSVSARSIMFTRMAVVHELAEGELLIPRVLRDLRMNPNYVSHRGMAMAYFSAADESLIASKRKADKIFNFDPAIFPASLTDDKPFRMQADDIVNGSVILDFFFEGLLRVANAPWSRTFTGPLASLTSIANITLNAIFHPVQAFAEYTGLAYWQMGIPYTYFAMGADGISQILAFIGTEWPCVTSKPLQVVVSLPFAGVELISGVITAWAYPPWTFGVPAPVNCSIVNCSQPPPAGWGFLDSIADYYAWNGSILRQDMYLLEEGGDCFAFAAGCNTTAPNNPNASYSNCSDAPWGCVARSTVKVLTAAINFTLSTAFYAPDLIQFNASRMDFSALPSMQLEVALDEWITCMGYLLDGIDPDQCLTSNEPPPRPTSPNVTVLPDPSGAQLSAPPRSEWECRLTNVAHYWDGRQVIVLNTTDPFNSQIGPLPCRIDESRQCSIAISESVQFMGSAPEDNVTIVAYPLWLEALGGYPLTLVYNATTGLPVEPVPNASTLLDEYNITAFITEDCTGTGIPPDALSMYYGCKIAQDYPEPVPPPPPEPSPVPSASPDSSPVPVPDTSPVPVPSPAISDGVGIVGVVARSQWGQYYGWNFAALTGPKVPCDTEVDDMVYCNTSTPQDTLWITTEFGDRQLWWQNTWASKTPQDVPLYCDGLVLRSGIICRFNSMQYVLKDYAGTGFTNRSGSHAIYYYPDTEVSNQRTFIPCENEPPSNYTCLGSFMNLGGTYLSSFLVTPDIIEPIQDFLFPCVSNPMTVYPTCTRLVMVYQGGDVLQVELEGGEVRVYANDVKEPTPCLYQSVPVIPAAGISTMSTSTEPTETMFKKEWMVMKIVNDQATIEHVEHDKKSFVQEQRGIEYLIKNAFARAEADHNKHDSSIFEPVATQSDLPGLLADQIQLGQQALTNIRAAASVPKKTKIMELLNYGAAAVYRKANFVCYTSLSVTTWAHFIVSTFFEAWYTVQSTLAFIADQSSVFYFPTFAIPRDEFRAALCATAGMYTTVIPITLRCRLASGGCQTFDTCAKNAICDWTDVPILIIDLAVSLLTTIRDLIYGIKPTDTILGSECSNKNPGGCIISFLLYVASHSIKTITMMFRSFSSVGDCILCLITNIGRPNTICITPFYSVINVLMNAIDGLGIAILKLALNLIVGIIECIIYLFSGNFGALWDSLYNKILRAIGYFFESLGTIIWNFLRELPVVGDIIAFILDLVQGACNIINDMLDFFGAQPLDCPSDLSKKRSLDHDAIGWLKASANVTHLWQTEAHASCGTRVGIINNTAWGTVIANPEISREAIFCMAVGFWLGPDAIQQAAEAAQENIFGDECDIRMPVLYRGSTTWPNLSPENRALALRCNKAKAAIVKASKNGQDASWIPTDIFTNPQVWVKLADDMFFAYRVYNHYSEDRSVPVTQLMSSGYAAYTQSKGFSTAHLDSIASTMTTIGEVEAAMSESSGVLSLDSYVDRAIANQGSVSNYKRARIVGLIKRLWQPIFNGTGSHVDPATNQSSSLIARLGQGIAKQLDQQLESRATSVSISSSFMSRLFASNDTNFLNQGIGNLVDGIMIDIPAIILRGGRLLSDAANEHEEAAKKREAMGEERISIPAYFWAAAQGALSLTKDLLTGQSRKTYEWFNSHETQAWLQAEANRGHPVRLDPLDTKGLWETQEGSNSSMITMGIQGILNAARAYLILPTMRGSQGILDLFHKSMSSTRASSSVIRRHDKLSRLFARAILASSDEALEGSRTQWRSVMKNSLTKHYSLMEVNNFTGKTCLFGLTNTTSNTTFYPLCQTCFALDQTLGRTIRAFVTVLTFYGMTPPNCTIDPDDPLCDPTRYGTLNYSLTQYNNFDAYIRDGDLPAVVGDSPELPAGWPWQHYDNWRWFGDPTPNKTGWGDLGELINATWVFILQAAGVDPSSIGGTIGISSLWEVPFKMQSIETQDRIRQNWNAITSHYDSILPVTRIFNGISSYLKGNTTSGDGGGGWFSIASDIPPGPYNSLSEVLMAWFDFIWGLRTCNYYEELNGAGKRFALAQTLVGGLLALSVLNIVVFVITKGNILFTLLSTLGGGFFLFITWLVLTYNYSYRCFYALPVGLGDDAIYMVAYNLFPRCLIGYGVVDQTFYDNSNCHQCSNWQSGMFTVPNFAKSFASGGHFGFADFRYNVAFWLRAAFPSIYDDLKPGSVISQLLPGINEVLEISFIREPLDAYADWDPDTVTPTDFRQFWQGSTWVTGISNYFIACAVLLAVFSILYPFIMQTLRIMIAIIAIIAPLILFIVAGVFMLSGFELPVMPIVQDETPEERKEKHHEEEEKRERRKKNSKPVTVDQEDNDAMFDALMGDYQMEIM